MSQAALSGSSVSAAPQQPDLPVKESETTKRLQFAILAVLTGGMLLITSFLAQIFWESEFYPSILAFFAALLLGGPLVYRAAIDLARGEANMNALVALAVLGALAIGSYQESAAVAFFMLLTVLIESRTAARAADSIEALIRITPTKAHKVTADGEVETEARDLTPGDIVRVRPGDNIPADGRIVRGMSTVNQANITGESLPVDKLEGDEVFGGTINLTGAMDIEVTKAGSDTTLGRVKELILEAEQTKIPILRMVDQYAGWYTPTVLMIVGIVLFFNLQQDRDAAFNRAIAMIVIAVPSAIILATPTAMVAALSAAARLGVLIKSVVTLEAARNLTAIVFDKTGTLTTGQLSVTRIMPMEGVEGVDLLRAAGLAEQNSRHPVARAVNDVVRKAKIALTQPDAFEEVAGRGVRATVAGHEILVGRATWMTDASAGLSEGDRQLAQQAVDSPEAEGLSLLFVARDRKLMGWIGLEDNAREEAPEAIDKLKSLGMKRLVILTGDRTSVAKRVASQMHMSEYKAEVLPHEKLDMVDELKDKGHRVAVVGDGVNDAPALAAGDLSIAMGAAGSDVAIHSASIALMNNNLNRIPFLINLSRSTIAVIQQNLLIGFVFILVFGTGAAMGWVTPIYAAMLHVVSGLAVIFNSARLVRSGEDIEYQEAQELNRRQAKTQRRRRVAQAAQQMQARTTPAGGA